MAWPAPALGIIFKLIFVASTDSRSDPKLERDRSHKRQPVAGSRNFELQQLGRRPRTGDAKRRALRKRGLSGPCSSRLRARVPKCCAAFRSRLHSAVPAPNRLVPVAYFRDIWYESRPCPSGISCRPLQTLWRSPSAPSFAGLGAGGPVGAFGGSSAR